MVPTLFPALIPFHWEFPDALTCTRKMATVPRPTTTTTTTPTTNLNLKIVAVTDFRTSIWTPSVPPAPENAAFLPHGECLSRSKGTNSRHWRWIALHGGLGHIVQFLSVAWRIFAEFGSCEVKIGVIVGSVSIVCRPWQW